MCLGGRGSNPNYGKEDYILGKGLTATGSQKLTREFRGMHPEKLKDEITSLKDPKTKEKHIEEGGEVGGSLGFGARMKIAQDELKRRKDTGLWNAAHSRRGIVTGKEGDYRFSSSGHSSSSPDTAESTRRKRMSLLIGGV